MGARAVLAALVVAAVLAAGCGGGGDDDEDDAGGQATEQAADTDDSGPRTGTEGEAATSPACELLTTAEVTDLFGEDAQVVPGEARERVGVVAPFTGQRVVPQAALQRVAAGAGRQ